MSFFIAVARHLLQSARRAYLIRKAWLIIIFMTCKKLAGDSTVQVYVYCYKYCIKNTELSDQV